MPKRVAVREPPEAPARFVAPSPRIPDTRADAYLQWAAIVTSACALCVVGGFPSAGSPAGQVFRGLALLGFWLIAPGAVVVTRIRLPGLAKLALAPLLGISILIAVATVGSWTGVWLPRLSVAVVAGAVLLASAVDASRGRLHLLAARRLRIRPVDLVLTLGLCGSLALWAVSLPGIRSARPSALGLLLAAPWTFAAAIAGATVVFLAALAARRLTLGVAAVLGLIAVLRTTASLASPVPIWAWTYKHVGLVLALHQHHHVAAGSDVYMNWPGMFAAGAYFSGASGVAPIDLARWVTPVIHILLALATAALAQALGARAPGALAAAGLVVVVNWVGQDYFSPQAIAICLAAGVIGLLVRSSTSRTCGVLALVLFAATVPTHQLTPVWLVGLTVVLAVLRRVPWWVAAGMALLLGGYLASRLDVAIEYGLFTGLDPLANAASSVPDVHAVGRETGGLFAKGNALLLWGSTCAVLAYRWRRRGWRRGWRSAAVLVPAAIVFSPFALLAAQSYGGEATLRVNLYSAIGCAAVLGPALASTLRRDLLSRLAAAGWTLLLVGLAAYSSFSLWFPSLVDPEDVQAAQWLATQHADADVIPIITDWPGRTAVDYERFIRPLATLEPGLDYLLTDSLPPQVRDQPLTIPLNPDVVTQVAQGNAPTTFVVFAASMRAYDSYYATYAAGSYEATLRGLLARPDWLLVRHQNDLWVFEYTGAHG